MPPIGDPHAGNVDQFTELLVAMFRGRAIVRVQSHIRLDDYQLPEPDLALLRPRPDYYRSSPPMPPDVFLVVEVADTTLRYDRRIKGPMYAHAGIPEYWLVDVNSATITVCRDPGPEGYRSEQTLRRGDRLSLLAFPDEALAVTDLLGEAP
jgi:Uma2 family endonuclease